MRAGAQRRTRVERGASHRRAVDRVAESTSRLIANVGCAEYTTAVRDRRRPRDTKRRRLVPPASVPSSAPSATRPKGSSTVPWTDATMTPSPAASGSGRKPPASPVQCDLARREVDGGHGPVVRPDVGRVAVDRHPGRGSLGEVELPQTLTAPASGTATSRECRMASSPRPLPPRMATRAGGRARGGRRVRVGWPVVPALREQEDLLAVHLGDRGRRGGADSRSTVQSCSPLLASTPMTSSGPDRDHHALADDGRREPVLIAGPPRARARAPAISAGSAGSGPEDDRGVRVPLGTAASPSRSARRDERVKHHQRGDPSATRAPRDREDAGGG